MHALELALRCQEKRKEIADLRTKYIKFCQKNNITIDKEHDAFLTSSHEFMEELHKFAESISV